MAELRGVATILFDVGNTLHHLDHGFVAGTVSALANPVTAHDVAVAEYEAKRAIDALFRARRGGNDSTRQVSYFETTLAALGVAPDAWPTIVRALDAENRRASLWRVMHPSTPGVLAELRCRGYVLGVVSNADGRVVAAIEAKGTAPYFRTIVDSHDVGVEKPDPRIFQIALDACGARPEAAVYVGDIYEIDVRGARAASITPVLLDPLSRYGAVDCLHIESLDRLLDLLE